MIEYPDGTFSDIFPAEELARRLREMKLEDMTMTAIRFGTPEELGSLKNARASFSEEFRNLKDRVAALELEVRRLRPSNSPVKIPGRDELIHIGLEDLADGPDTISPLAEGGDGGTGPGPDEAKDIFAEAIAKTKTNIEKLGDALKHAAPPAEGRDKGAGHGPDEE